MRGPFTRNPYDGRRYIKSWFIWRLCSLFPGHTFWGHTIRRINEPEDAVSWDPSPERPPRVGRPPRGQA